MRIEMHDISRNFKDVRALSGVNWTIDCDVPETTALVGPNGAGKTTLLKIMTGLMYPTSGESSVFDGDAILNPGDKKVRSTITMVLASDRNLYFRNTVRENVQYLSAIRGYPPRLLEDKLIYYSEQLNMTHLLKTEAGNLSTGERKKASILTGLCTETKLLIMDEPSTGLDIHAVIELQQILMDIRRNGSMSVIVSSHDIRMLSEISTKYIFLNRGNIVWQNDAAMSSDEIIHQYEAFVGGGGM